MGEIFPLSLILFESRKASGRGELPSLREFLEQKDFYGSLMDFAGRQ